MSVLTSGRWEVDARLFLSRAITAGGPLGGIVEL